MCEFPPLSCEDTVRFYDDCCLGCHPSEMTFVCSNTKMMKGLTTREGGGSSAPPRDYLGTHYLNRHVLARDKGISDFAEHLSRK